LVRGRDVTSGRLDFDPIQGAGQRRHGDGEENAAECKN
jgi:hypothetical protein